PAGGFVTGGGHILSPAGAYALDLDESGRAPLGIVSKYQNGGTVPVGQTQFKVADLNFHSTSYDWLVVSGDKAQYQGSGTVNGDGDYGFIVTVIDGGANDTFRIKIWEKEHALVIYDDQPGAPNS